MTKLALSYDDILLVPQYSEVKSRKDVDLSVDLGRDVKLKIPIISANMVHIAGNKMIRAIAELGGLAVMHRFDEYTNILKNYETLIHERSDFKYKVAVSVGVKPLDYWFVDRLLDADCKIFCVDVAHGDHILCHDMVKYIRNKSEALIIAGNVATAGGAKRLYQAGADVVKCGVGNGSICSTRIQTGNGVPTITALEQCYLESLRFEKKLKIIADGGIRNSGDITKSLVFADAVMIGNILAATDESPGEKILSDGQEYKEYAGSSTLKSNFVEGYKGYVKCKGPVKKVIEQLMEGLASGCSYQGAKNLSELKGAEYIQITNSGLIESHAHDIVVKK